MLNNKYIADVTSHPDNYRDDYYPYGMLLPNRHESSNEYRYGFNGKEKDDEITGVEGSHLDFGARISVSSQWEKVQTLYWGFNQTGGVMTPVYFSVNPLFPTKDIQTHDDFFQESLQNGPPQVVADP